MKRNNTLILNILLELENLPKGSPARQMAFDRVNQNTLNEHLVLLDRHRFLECIVIRDGSATLTEVQVKRLTPQGRELLAHAKVKPVWKSAIAAAGHRSFPDFVDALYARAEEAAEA